MAFSADALQAVAGTRSGAIQIWTLPKHAVRNPFGVNGELRPALELSMKRGGGSKDFYGNPPTGELLDTTGVRAINAYSKLSMRESPLSNWRDEPISS